MTIVSQPANKNYRNNFDETFKKVETQEIVLKPCPWCGHTPKLKNDPMAAKVVGDHSDEYYVACCNNECNVDALTRGIGTIAEVTTMWNTRKV